MGKQFENEPIYYDGRHYDLHHSYLVEDIPFYLECASEFGGPALELACGTGRITIPLAKTGLDITGIDLSESMLERAKQKSIKEDLNISWIRNDMINFDLNRKFRFIFIPFNSIMVLYDYNRIESFFRCLKNHLEPDGYFVLDYFNPDLDILLRKPDTRYPVIAYKSPVGNDFVKVTETLEFDRMTQINHIVWYYDVYGGDDFVEHLDMRIFFPQELDAILKFNGLGILNKYGNFDRSPFEGDSPKQIYICKLIQG